MKPSSAVLVAAVVIVVFVVGLYAGKKIGLAKCKVTDAWMNEVKASCSDAKFYGDLLDLGLDITVLNRIRQKASQESWEEIYPFLLKRLSVKVEIAEKGKDKIPDPQKRETIERKINDAKEVLNGAL